MVSTPGPVEQSFTVFLSFTGGGSLYSAAIHEGLELAGVDVSDRDIGAEVFLELSHGLL